jgi:excisionase family DNA binding protein
MDTNTQAAPLFLRISEAARLLAMSRSSAYEAVRKGVIPAARIDGKCRIPRAALERFAADALVAADAAPESAR